jgi:putative transposase
MTRETDMKGTRFKEEQIIRILKEADSGVPTKELCRQHGIAAQTLYRWKAKFGGVEVSDARKLKSLEEENRKLKRIVADQALDIVMLKDINSKKW